VFLRAGGERSFTTVAFILALGKFTESPFRAMDEYDVFMDAVNRRIATQTLLEFALEENNLQFVLLTPQVGLLDKDCLGYRVLQNVPCTQPCICGSMQTPCHSRQPGLHMHPGRCPTEQRVYYLYKMCYLWQSILVLLALRAVTGPGLLGL
jgi:hypothetical protein